MWPTRRRSCGRRPRRNWARSACRRPSGPLPGRADRRSPATSSTIPRRCAGERVLDFASGSGLVAIAAMKAGAAEVTACDIDPFAIAAIGLNAAANGVSRHRAPGRHRRRRTRLGHGARRRHLLRAATSPPGSSRGCSALRGRGATVLIGDPGRSYLPKDRLDSLAVYQVPGHADPRGFRYQEVRRLALSQPLGGSGIAAPSAQISGSPMHFSSSDM